MLRKKYKENLNFPRSTDIPDAGTLITGTGKSLETEFPNYERQGVGYRAIPINLTIAQSTPLEINLTADAIMLKNDAICAPAEFILVQFEAGTQPFPFHLDANNLLVLEKGWNRIWITWPAQTSPYSNFLLMFTPKIVKGETA